MGVASRRLACESSVRHSAGARQFTQLGVRSSDSRDMTYCSTHPGATRRRAAALCLLTSLLSGCSFNESSTRIRSLPEPPSERLRLVRSDAPALTGTFRQDGHAVLGELAFTTECVNERTLRVRRESLTETRNNRTTSTAWAIVGGAFAAAGTGLLIASRSADKRVYCGNGDTVMDGDQCRSLSGLESDVGFTTVLTGAVIAASAGIFALRKPSTTITDLPTEQRQSVTAPVACGKTAALEGTVVALELPQNGKWTGRVSGDGMVRIDVNPTIALPDQATLPVVVDSVPPSLAEFVHPGLGIGTVTLTGRRAEGAKLQPKLAGRR